ncbi:MAG: prolipoprotein diacylglyceryl transferase [Pusillimonas sp.]
MYPILLSTPYFNIYSYGLFVALGYAVGMLITLYEVKKEKLNAEAIFDMLLLQLPIGIAGSRFLFMLEYTPEKLSFTNFISFEQGGLTFYGSVISSFIFNLLYLKFRRIPFWRIMDCIGFGLPLGIMIARIGCFLNGCCYGVQCSSSIGFHFRHAGSGFFHATQLYESFAALLIFVIIQIYRKYRQNYGEVFMLMIGSYAFLRFFIEFLRAENPIVFMGLTLSQIISIITIAAFIATFKLIKKMPDLRIIPETNIVSIK